MLISLPSRSLLLAATLTVLGCGGDTNEDTFVPIGSYTLSEEVLRFTPTPPGGASYQTLVVTSDGPEALEVEDVATLADEAFVIEDDSSTWPASVAVGETFRVVLGYHPDEETSDAVGALQLITSAGDILLPMEVHVPGVPVVAPNPVRFEAVSTGSTAEQTVHIRNTGEGILSVDSVVFTGDEAFSFDGSEAGGTSLDPQGTLSLPITFTPPNPGAFVGTLTVETDGMPATVTVSVSGLAN